MLTTKTAVIIPSYKVSSTLKQVIESLPDSVHSVIVVDDGCPEHSGKVAESLKRPNVVVLYHGANRGVGAAVTTGYKKALELGCDIVVKMDGDGQMDPRHLKHLLAPLIKGDADYTKGNRFRDFRALKAMPKVRLFGNSALSFLVKFASGYWNIMDPTNGYTAIHRRALEELDLEKIAKRYFFESDMLINLNIANAVVQDVPMPARYGAEASSLNIRRVLLHFPFRLMKGLFKRVFLKYFIYDFNMASLYLIIGGPLFAASVLYGTIEWLDSIMTGTAKSPGTIMLVALPIIVSFQMLLQAVNIDINLVPRKK